jgi:hypothetical protein
MNMSTSPVRLTATPPLGSAALTIGSPAPSLPAMVTVNGVVSTELSMVATSSLDDWKVAPVGGTPLVQLSGSLQSPLPAAPAQEVEIAKAFRSNPRC